jgi:2-C-methyl-D-erythritol 4-phosphate cytidylyltransferase/2-C-methyl-D-erythritol 2,4-cyclodiphosphate synthase
VDEVIIAIADDHQAHLRDALGDVRHVTGGATRRQSVWNGLEALRSGPPNRILVHDAARPFLPAAVIDRVLEPLGDHSGATPGLAVADTLVRADGVIGDVVPREHLYRVQTPQAFRFDDLVAAHLAWNGQVEPTDDAQMVRAAGSMVAMVAGDPMLEKITYPQDFTRAEQMVSARCPSAPASASMCTHSPRARSSGSAACGSRTTRASAVIAMPMSFSTL